MSAPTKKKKRKGAKEQAAPAPWWLAGVAGVGLLGLTLWAWAPREVPEPHVEEGNRRYQARRYNEALQQYEEAPGAGPRYAGVHLDRGLARFRSVVPQPDGGGLPLFGMDAGTPLGYTQAQEEFRTAARGGTTGAAEDVEPFLRARAAFDLANSFFSYRQWDRAIESYKEALRLRPGWIDAAWNLELARRLRELDRNPPDAGNDASQDATQDASQDAPQNDAAQDAPQDARDAGTDAPMDGSDSGNDGGNDGGGDGGEDAGDAASDGGSGGRNDGGRGDGGGDAGVSVGNDGGPAEDGGAGTDAGEEPQDAEAPRSMAPLDDLDRSSRSLQQELLRRRGLVPRGPDDDR